MATCARCSGVIPEGSAACPNCNGEYPAADESLREQLSDLNRKWSVHPFSRGWRAVDVVLRVLIMAALVWFTIDLNNSLAHSLHEGREVLDSHKRVLDELQGSRTLNTAQIETLKTNYSNLQSSASRLLEAQGHDSRLHVLALLGFIVLLAVGALTNYRTYKELNKLRSGFQFLFTYEGRRVLDRVAPSQEEQSRK